MSRRIDVELTSDKGNGVWTWRSAGAREPKGTVNAGLIPASCKVGDIVKVEADFGIDGITVLLVVPVKGKEERADLLKFLPSQKTFEPVTQQLAKHDRDAKRGPSKERGPSKDGAKRGPRRDTAEGGDRTKSDRPRRDRPHFTPPPDTPQRPRLKRLRAGNKHKNEILASLPDAERTIAEIALKGGIPAVRFATAEQNKVAKAQGKQAVPADGLVAIAEKLLPKLRVADWLDRAEGAKADIEHLDLRDLRSIVVAAEDPVVARDESTRQLAAELKIALTTRQEEEYKLWLIDIDTAVSVGRVIRALKASSQPPKAGVRFPVDLAGKLVASTLESLTPDALPERWIAVLEALAFSPVRSLVKPTAPPAQVSDQLRATILRLGPLLPEIASLLSVEIPKGAAIPKPLRLIPPNRKRSAKELASGTPTSKTDRQLN